MIWLTAFIHVDNDRFAVCGAIALLRLEFMAWTLKFIEPRLQRKEVLSTANRSQAARIQPGTRRRML